MHSIRLPYVTVGSPSSLCYCGKPFMPVSFKMVDDVSTPNQGPDRFDEHEDDDTYIIHNQNPGRKRKRTSMVWSEFDVHIAADNIEYGTCKHCKSVSYKTESSQGTSGFKRHLLVCPIYLEKKKEESDELVVRGGYDHATYGNLIGRAIFLHGLPFSWVEYEGVRAIHKYLNADVKSMCRNTAKRICLKNHREMKEKLKLNLASLSSSICFTTDIWTSCTSQAYLALTGHFVDDNWSLRSLVLSFCHLPPPHTGLDIHDLLLELIKDWGIEHKVFTITIDNASNMDNMVSHLRSSLIRNLPCDGKHFHVRCSAHILNLIVKDGLKVIEECVSKVRDNVKYIGGSESRTINFFDTVRELNMPFTVNLWLDVATRWNSTYVMLSRACHYRRALDRYSQVQPNYKYRLSPSEWLKVEKICDLLEPFYDITTLFSGTKFPTSNLYFCNVWKIQIRLEKAMISDDPDIKEMAKDMYAKFKKYWAEYLQVLSFAVILDPRFKKDCVEWVFTKMHGKSNGQSMTRDIYVQFVELFEHYEAKQSVPEVVVGRANQDHDLDMEEFDLSCANSSIHKAEFESYLQSPRMERTVQLDVLSYWKDHEIQYPILSSMAKDILAIPITSVAFESTFSVAGRILSKWRSSLLPKNANALVTTRSWLYGYDADEVEGISIEPRSSSDDD